jgi:hypothetical protein
MRKLGVYPDVYLGHQRKRINGQWEITDTWYTQVLIPRPERGKAVYRVNCSHCGRIVTWKISSARRTRRMRRRELLMGLIGLGALIGGIVKFNHLEPTLSTGSPSPGQIALIGILFLGGFVFFLGGLAGWFSDQGVRVPEWRHVPVRPRRGMPHVPSY